MSDNISDHSEETEITHITDSYGEPIEYDGNPAHAEGYLAAMGEYLDNSEFAPLFEHRAVLSLAALGAELVGTGAAQAESPPFIKDRTTEQTYPNGTRTAQIRAHTAPSNRYTNQSPRSPPITNTHSRAKERGGDEARRGGVQAPPFTDGTTASRGRIDAEHCDTTEIHPGTPPVASPARAGLLGRQV